MNDGKISKDDPYLLGWMAMTRMMSEGASWSGRERNCCFLNLGDGTFADVSAVTGLNLIDDGRSVAVADWDADGDLDLWLKNRTGPSLRFMRNRAELGAHWIALKLVGRECNRDAIGAKVEIVSGGKKHVRYVTAGDGYLSQSSKWLHFGLGQADRIERITVRWPGAGTQELGSLEVDRQYRVEQSAAPVALPRRSVPERKQPAAPPAIVDPPGHRIVLKVPLPLPPTLLDEILGPAHGKRAKLINLWAQWCAPCVTELRAFASQSDRLHQAGLDIVALNVDKTEDRSKASATFDGKIAPAMGTHAFGWKPVSTSAGEVIDALLQHVCDRAGAWSLPTSLLIDRAGNLQVVYLGPVEPDTVMADTRTFGYEQPPAHQRSSFAGRWFYRVPRNYPGLAKDLEGRGQTSEAKFYRDLDQTERAAAKHAN